LLSNVIENFGTRADLTLLPLIHTTTFAKAKRIIESKYLDVSDCDTFKGEKLNYFFYSKAEYRDREGNKHDPSEDDLYVTFVFFDDTITPYRIFPFDTGAWARGFYESAFRRNFEDEKEKFYIPNTYEALISYVKIVWGNNENYINQVTDVVYSEHMNSCFNDILELLKSKTGNVDNRKRTPEIQSNSGISINKNTVRTVILHRGALLTNDGYMKKKLTSELEIPYKCYDKRRANGHRCPNEFLLEIENEIYQILCNERLLKTEE